MGSNRSESYHLNVWSPVRPGALASKWPYAPRQAVSPWVVIAVGYGDGWLYEVEAESDEDFNSLMTAEEYEEFLATQED